MVINNITIKFYILLSYVTFKIYTLMDIINVKFLMTDDPTRVIECRH